MGIVFITIYGDSQRAFVNTLNRETGGKVDLVIFQKPKPRKLWGRIRRAWRAASSGGFARELWYGLLLRIERRTSEVLRYFKVHATFERTEGHDPRIIEMDDINSDEVHALLKKISPDLLMVLGSDVLKPYILATAKHAINLHMGLCPHYRGAVANQFAILRGDKERIGSTIHYMERGVDQGDVIAQVRADTSKPPREMFRTLNEETLRLYIEVARKILAGEKLPIQKQDPQAGELFRLHHWTNEARYGVVSRILRWEQRGEF